MSLIIENSSPSMIAEYNKTPSQLYLISETHVSPEATPELIYMTAWGKPTGDNQWSSRRQAW